MKHLRKLLIVLSLLAGQQAIAQDELFHELYLEKRMLDREQWEVQGEATWKHAYDDAPWGRWGVSMAGVRKIKKLGLLAGVNGYYTLNRKITDFVEVRPWLAATLQIPLTKRILLRQRLSYEWRFFFEADAPAQEDYRRLRYQVDFDISLSRESEHSWRIRPCFEWYFIRDPATFERFPNQRDYGVRFIKPLVHEHELSLGYKLEEFYNPATTHGNGHVLSVGYSF